jgi:molybdopterin/thiamine biosynthesis adenylyltransferase
MAIVKMGERVWDAARAHLGAHPERFGFFLADTALASDGPIFIAQDFVPIADTDVHHGAGGYEIDLDVLLRVVNRGVREGRGLVEAHSHGGALPRFSRTVDRPGLAEFVPYVLDSLPRQPYAATVWGADAVYGEWFLAGGDTGVLRSILITGPQLLQVVSRDDDHEPIPTRFDRQLPWFSDDGQRALGRLRVGVVGNGGTGSHAITQCTYLGMRDFVTVEFDPADDTNLNRLVTAAAADEGTPKGVLARRTIKAIAPDARVELIARPLQSGEALDALKSVDLIIGCVDNDGARLILNELALAYGIPYFDVASGIEPAGGGRLESIGGRVAVVLPDGPCLHCMGEIDTAEARFYNATPDQQAVARARGYAPVKAPAVVSLNGLISSALVNELAIWVSGLRPLSVFTELELIDPVRKPGQWLTPRSGVVAVPDCIECTYRGLRDGASLERYVGVRS